MVLLTVGVIYVVSFSYLYLRCNDRLPLHKYLSNHVLPLAPLNFLFTFFTFGKQQAVFAAQSVPGLDRMKGSYPAIRDEAKAVLDAGLLQRPPLTDEPGLNTFEKTGWRVYPIKWYTKECNRAALQACPQTCAIVDSIPAVRAAMFTVLPPGVRLTRHHDPVASSLRYHLGLLTPNSDQCAMTLDGTQYAWFDGEDLLFDQTYLHSVVNLTQVVRVILFCDVEKIQLIPGVRAFADLVNSKLVAKFSGEHEKGKRSWISSVYMPIYKVRHYIKAKVRPRSKLAYNVIKFSSLIALLLLIYSVFNLASRLI